MYLVKPAPQRGKVHTHASRDRCVTLCGQAVKVDSITQHYADQLPDVSCQECHRQMQHARGRWPQ